nr:hypothetical protein [Pseudoxanthomonas jiangsuensis]
MVLEVGHGALPDLAGPRQDVGRLVAFGGVQFGLQGGYLGLGALELGAGAGRDDAGADGLHDVVAHALGIGQAAADGGVVRRGRAQGVRDRSLEHLVRGVAEQVALDAGQNRALGRRARDAQLAGACAAVLGHVAAVVVAVDHDERAAAAFAAQQAAEQVPRLAAGLAVGIRVGLAVAAQARLHGGPGVGVDDGQLGLLGGDPLRFRALLAHAAAGVRVLDPMAAVPHLPADVDGVGEDADAALRIAVDGGAAPGLAAGGAHVLGVEARGDGARAVAGDELGVDAAHDVRLLGIDDALPSAGDAVAVGQAAGAGAAERAAGEAAVGLVGEVIQVQLRHEPAQPDIDLVAAALGVHAVAHANQAHAGEREALDGLADLVLVAAEAGEVVDQQHVVVVDLREQALVAGAVEPRAADRCVGVLDGRRQVVARAPAAAVAQLVLEAGLALLV